MFYLARHLYLVKVTPFLFLILLPLFSHLAFAETDFAIHLEYRSCESVSDLAGEPILNSARLHLENLNTGDLEPFHRLCNLPAVSKMHGFEPGSRSMNFCRGLIKRQTIDFSGPTQVKLRFGIWMEEKFVGYSFVYPSKLNPEIERLLSGREPLLGRWVAISYSVDPDYWNQGIASEAVEAILQYLFQTLRMDGVLADVLYINPASRKVLEKQGFTPYNHGANWELMVLKTPNRFRKDESN